MSTALPERTPSPYALAVIGAALFALSTAVIVACSRSSLPALPMCGGGAMTMWAPHPGQGWPGAALAFGAMWTPMMMAMMLPALLPLLWDNYRARFEHRLPAAGLCTLLVGLAYFSAWSLVGVLVFTVGGLWHAIAVRFDVHARTLCVAVVVVAGIVQFTPWKRRLLERCVCPADVDPQTSRHLAAAWRDGLRLAAHCIPCCANLTAILLVVGLMDLRVMTLMTVVITIERAFARGRGSSRLKPLTPCSDMIATRQASRNPRICPAMVSAALRRVIRPR